MNIWKIIYLNCGEKYEAMINQRSYIHNLSSSEIKAWKKIQAERDSYLTSAIQSVKGFLFII